VSEPRTRTVARGYDTIADRFADWQARIKGDPRAEWTAELMQMLPERARIVDLGCGAGLPSTKLFADAGYEVKGVDISAEQIRRARRNVPSADFLHADITELALEPASVDAVTAYYSLNHVPREILGSFLARISGWLAPGGLLLAAFGAGNCPDWTGEWLGATMFFSSWDARTNRRLIQAAELETIRDEVVTLREPEGDTLFQWILATR
jgi:ubiquinone/menaquinone biosynthesis C-methylase UbiE